MSTNEIFLVQVISFTRLDDIAERLGQRRVSRQATTDPWKISFGTHTGYHLGKLQLLKHCQ
jgi:hypothetical protein